VRTRLGLDRSDVFSRIIKYLPVGIV